MVVGGVPLPGQLLRSKQGCCQLVCASLIQLDRSLLQGLSQAGDQQGLDDVRSALVKEVFLVFDRMPNGRESQK